MGQRQSEDLEEMGVYWAATYVDLHTVFSYQPMKDGDHYSTHDRGRILGKQRCKPPAGRQTASLCMAGSVGQTFIRTMRRFKNVHSRAIIPRIIYYK